MPAATETQQSQPLTREQQEQRLSDLLDELQQQRDAEAISLPAALGLPVPITSGELAGFSYQSPMLIQTHRILKAWNTLESMPPESIDAILKHQQGYAELVCILTRIEDGDGYRRPSAEEVMARFRDVTHLKTGLAQLLRGDGFGGEDKDAKDPNA